MRAWVGTAGYSYPEWVGPFYPPGTAAGDRLGEYARHFPLVELNHTFYGCPPPDRLARAADRAPDGFRFTVKLPRTLSHDLLTTELELFRLGCFQLHARGKLGGVLCQTPEAFTHTPANRAWLEFLGRELAACGPVAVEFRHRSWHRPEVPAWLAASGLELCCVDVPDLPRLYPRGPAWAGGLFYARLHSRSADAWYSVGKAARYDYDYPDDALREWVAGLRRAAAAGVGEAVVVFNNCTGVQAVANARRFLELLAAEAPEVAAVPAPAPRRRDLFDGL